MFVRAAIAVLLITILGALRAGEDPPSATQPTSRAAQPPERLKIVTFNLHYCQRGFGAIIRFLREQDADIVLLQEVIRNRTDLDDRAAQIAKALGYRHVVSGRTLGLPKDQDCDVAILSKLGLAQPRALSLEPGGRVYAISATADFGARRMRVFTVHTRSTSRLEVQHLVESSKTRFAQISRLLDAVEELEHDVIVAGDFNAVPFMPEYFALTLHLRDLGSINDSLKLTFPGHRPSIRIDYVFARGNIAARSYTVPDVFLSDHRPVVVELERRASTSMRTSQN